MLTLEGGYMSVESVMNDLETVCGKIHRCRAELSAADLQGKYKKSFETLLQNGYALATAALWYCDALQWSDICAAIRPLRVRRDGRQVTYKKGAGVSETTIFRVRLEALAAAEVEFRRLGIG